MTDVETWLRCSDVMARLHPGPGAARQIKRMLVERAAAGIVRARARVSIDGGMASELRDLERAFFANMINPDIDGGDWRAGDFQSRSRGVGQRASLTKAFGTLFAASSIWEPAGPSVESKRAAAPQSKTSARIECEAWLRDEFADPDKTAWTKPRFWKAAQLRWAGKLSERGFNFAWTAPAAEFGRNKGGPKVASE